MKIILFGATGMVGQCVLTECLKSSKISEILVIGRKRCGITDSIIKEVLHKDFQDYSKIEKLFNAHNACFYCLGVSSLGMTKEQYHEITFDYTVAVAEALKRQNPNIRFSFISGAGTDETERSRTFWAREKGKAENILREYPFKSLSLFRPAYIKALDGINPSYSLNKYFDWLLYPTLKVFFPKTVITSKELGLGMINSVFQKEKVKIIENSGIKELAYLKI